MEHFPGSTEPIAVLYTVPLQPDKIRGRKHILFPNTQVVCDLTFNSCLLL